jgi:hypothetical protein
LKHLLSNLVVENLFFLLVSYLFWKQNKDIVVIMLQSQLANRLVSLSSFKIYEIIIFLILFFVKYACKTNIGNSIYIVS